MAIGKVFLVGAGPGDPGLLTQRGLQVLAACDVVVYDRLIGAELLECTRADAEKIYVGKAAAQHVMTQDNINVLLVERALNGQSVCRLKGGDPFVFGRGGEEALECRTHNVPFEIVPGISSSIAAPAYAGIPVTHRGVATSFAVVTGHTQDDDAPPSVLPVADTLVFLMGVRALTKIVAQLLERGESPDKPVALVRWGTTEQQQVVVGTLETIVDDVARSGLKPPALIVVGEVVKLRDELAWFDNRPLSNRTAIVTRAREQASELVNLLRENGARVVQCPTIRVEALEDNALVDRAISELADFHWVVFTSVNGVEHFWQRLQNVNRDARAFANAKIAAIGPATRDALRARGLEADFVPESSISEDVARGLIENGVEKQQILMARALEGREVLIDALEKAGALVMVAPCYRTVPDNSDAQMARDAIMESGEKVWVSFTSSSTVRNFLDALGEDWVKAQRDKFRVACIGPITARTAEENGITPDAVAADASIEALVQILIESEA